MKMREKLGIIALVYLLVSIPMLAAIFFYANGFLTENTTSDGLAKACIIVYVFVTFVSVMTIIPGDKKKEEEK